MSERRRESCSCLGDWCSKEGRAPGGRVAELFLDRDGAMETGPGMIKKPHPRIPFLHSIGSEVKL